jgi:uncharacterized protein
MPMPETTGADARAIILAAPPPEANRPARRPPVDIVSQLAAAKETVAASIEQQFTPEQQAEQQQKLDRILSAILAEPNAAFRAASVLYQEFVVRCRIEGLGSAAPNLGVFRRMLTYARAGLPGDMEADLEWQEVSLRAATLPEDMQGVFLLIARAAKATSPCPSDTAIAHAYGTHSLRRARRTLAYFEEQGHMVCQLDGMGRRIVTLVESGWTTTPGNPNAEELVSDSCDIQ